MRGHKEEKHKGIIYSCDQCEFTTPRQGNLKQHKHTKHIGIKYMCDICNFSPPTLSKLNIHTKMRHDEISQNKYPCARSM